MTASLAAFTGIQISTRLLNDITISPDEKTARFQAGVYALEVHKKLWEYGFVTSKSFKSFLYC